MLITLKDCKHENIMQLGIQAGKCRLHIAHRIANNIHRWAPAKAKSYTVINMVPQDLQNDPNNTNLDIQIQFYTTTTEGQSLIMRDGNSVDRNGAYGLAWDLELTGYQQPRIFRIINEKHPGSTPLPCSVVCPDPRACTHPLPNVLHLSMVDCIGQMREESAAAEIARLTSQQPGSIWVKDFTPQLCMDDDYDQDAPATLSPGYCWVIRTN